MEWNSNLTWFVSFIPNLLTALLAGTIVGIERHRHHSPIGVRTCALVCVGASTYMATGHLILDGSHMTGDPTRIASQVITGIGFLGAGAILRGSGGVTGLTSAATIWFLGALGILIGCQYKLAGLLLAVTVTTILAVLDWFEKRFKARRPSAEPEAV